MFIFQHQNTLNGDDYTKSLIFFGFMNFSRYIMINLLLPLINKSGYPLNWKDVIVLSYGGVRGSLGLALALIIYRDDGYNERFKDIVLFFVAVMIVLSVIFNGLTIGYVMRLINFAPINPLTYKIKNNVLKNVVISSLKKGETMRNNKFLRLANWEEVKQMSGIERLVKAQKQDIEKYNKLVKKDAVFGQTPKELSPLKQPIKE